MKKFLAQAMQAKVILLAVLTWLAALPLSQISGLIDERGTSRQAAATELAARHAGPQVVTGPFLAIPYTERWSEVQLDEQGKVKRRTEHSRQRVHLVFPERNDLRGKLDAQERYLGIFNILFYGLQGSMRGRFPAFDPGALPQHEKGSTVDAQQPVLAFATSDLRGLQGAPALVVAGAPARWQPRVPGVPDGSWLAQGIHAPLPEAALKAIAQRQPFDFQLDLRLVGQERLAIVPLADENTAHLASAWPHPSFGGKFLATRRTVGAQGFDADWAVSSLVSSARAQLRQAVGAGAANLAGVETFDVSLIEPLNVHALSKRAVKYGLLFVALTFMAAFMFEL